MQITLYFRCSFLILGLFLVGAGSAWGQEQEYRPMLGEFGKWHEYFTPGPTCNATLRIDGDSIVNGVSYKKIIADPGCSAILNEGTVRLLREDTLEKKVYELWSLNWPEDLIYDFSLMPGDTFYWGNNNENIMILDSISDTIVNPFFCNGNNIPTLTIENPRVFYFDAGGAYATIWIEGIGSLGDLFNSQYEWGGGVGSFTILCHFNEFREQDFHYIFCEEPHPCEGWVTVNTEDINKDNVYFDIFPNPTFGLIHLNTKELTPYKTIELICYDTNGKERLRNSNSSKLDIKFLPKGIYFLKVIFDNRQIYIQKIIKY